MTANDTDADVELALKQLTSSFGVSGYLVMNDVGVPLKFQGLDQTGATLHSSLLSELINKTSSFIKKVDNTDELMVLRLRTNKGEIIVTQDDNFSMVVLQDPNYVEPIVQTVVSTEEKKE